MEYRISDIRRSTQWLVIAAMVAVLVAGPVYADAQGTTTDSVVREIRDEAGKIYSRDTGYPLPLAAHWNTGQLKNGFSPGYQMRMIEQGHFLLPWFQLPEPATAGIDHRYYENAIKRAAELKLPITFVSTQWEKILSEDPAYLYLPPEKNPNVVRRNGAILRKVSPFGPIDPWRSAGKRWTSQRIFKMLQAWYPNPPLVLFLSNNEHAKLRWPEVEQDSRYLAGYGQGKDDDFKRKVVGDGWIERYRALQQGMVDGLTEHGWKERSVFVGYEAFTPIAFGRWADWIKYSLCTRGRIDPGPLAWDGASLPFYVHNWDSSTDYTVMSPQIEAMNWVPMLEEARRWNGSFRVELSVWDGNEPAKTNDKRKFYAGVGQTFSPERYEGYVQFGMWLLRPCVVREFRGWTDTLARTEPYFRAVVASVDRVHSDPVLRRFWRSGRLVANLNHTHPYQANLPDGYRAAARWFLLDTNLDPKRPWGLMTELPVFSLALVLGEKPEREWLVYAHSPRNDAAVVNVDVPGFGSVTVATSPGGCFHHLAEKDRAVRRVAQ
jgi:hypothetical protein